MPVLKSRILFCSKCGQSPPISTDVTEKCPYCGGELVPGPIWYGDQLITGSSDAYIYDDSSSKSNPVVDVGKFYFDFEKRPEIFRTDIELINEKDRFKDIIGWLKTAFGAFLSGIIGTLIIANYYITIGLGVAVALCVVGYIICLNKIKEIDQKQEDWTNWKYLKSKD